MDADGEYIAGLVLADAAQDASELPSDNVNISDVLEALQQADPSYDEAVAERGLERAPLAASEDRAQPPPAGAGFAATAATMAQRLPAVHIVEQPAPKALRFRYECEGRSAGSIPGANSTSENKLYPTIRISNYTGKATIVVSCVTKDEPYRPHPHNLVGREGCNRGVFTVKVAISAEANEYQFRNLGIQCVKRRDIQDALQNRSQLRVDPFRTGFEHRNNPQSIDLNAVRLAFQVFLHTEGARPGEERLLPLPPLASDIIYDKKAMCDLQIMRASHCSGPVAGGTQIILLCEKVTREDTVVVFYQEDGGGRVVWESPATTLLVHKQVAIVFETPRYSAPGYDARAQRHVTARFRLRRLTDNQHSNSLDFEYIPDYPDSKKRKVVMSCLTADYAETYGLEPPIKIEPNRTPPHNLYPQAAAAAYQDPQGQWQSVEGGGAGAAGGAGGAAWGGAQFAQYAAPSPYGPSPHASPLGAMSPHANLQSPMAPTPCAGAGPVGAGGAHSPLGPALSPALHLPHYHHQHQLQQPPPYHLNQGVGGEQMDTGGSTSFSALLEAGAGGPLAADHDLFSLNSLEGRDNLSDSLRNLSTNDLLH